MAADYDVVIVGARVAGASLAILLGKQGRRVLLVDRDRFPSDTLSTHFIGPLGVAALDRLGVLAEVEASGLRRLTRMRTYVGDCVIEGPVAGSPPHTYGLAPRRNHLDSVLIRHAERTGSVELREQTSLDHFLTEDDRVVGAVLRTAGSGRDEVRARVVVGADGRNSRVAELVRAPSYQGVPALRPGYYVYLNGLAPLPEPAVELFFDGPHIGFIFPMEPGIDCVAMELEPEDFEVFRRDLDRCFDRRLRSFYGLESRLAGAQMEGPIRGTRGIDNFLRHPYGPGWALSGDAAYCKDPSTGLGISDAFTQAFLLAEALGGTLDGADWEGTMAAYHRKRDAAVLPSYQATIDFTREGPIPADALAWLRAISSAPPFVRSLARNLPAAAAAPGVYSPQQLVSLGKMSRLLRMSDATTKTPTPHSIG